MRMTALAGAMLALAAVAPAAAAPPELKFAFPSAPHGQFYGALTRWGEDVQTSSGGAVTVRMFAGPSLATALNVYDRVTSGVADAAWTIIGPISRQFPKTGVVTLPFEARDSNEAALALWHLYETGLIADEYRRVKLLSFVVFANVSLQSRSKDIHALADLKGLKISGQGRWISRTIERLGAAPITLPVPELYQSLQRGVVDAAAIGWPAVVDFKLYEVARYHLDTSLANDEGMVCMNNDAYARLPAGARAAIDRLSGEKLVKELASVTAKMFTDGRSTVGAMPGQTISTLTPTEEARWHALVTPVSAEWVKATPDGARVLAAYRQEIATIRAKK